MDEFGEDRKAMSFVEEVKRFAAAVQFLTRLPTPKIDWRDDRLARAQRYFPMAGVVVGTIAAVTWSVTAVFLPNAIAAGLALAVLLVVTGALHEDGLADLADAIGGATERGRALEIMRDSRIGSYGTIALVVAIGLRWAALASMPISAGVFALIAAPAIGRAAMVPATALALPARTDGLGASLGIGANPNEVGIALSIALLASVLSGFGVGLLALIVGLVAGMTVLAYAVRRLGGYTGDVLGAIAVVAECAAFVVLAGALA